MWTCFCKFELEFKFELQYGKVKGLQKKSNSRYANNNWADPYWLVTFFLHFYMHVFVNCHLRDFILQTWQKSKKNCQNKSNANLFHQADMSLIWGTALKQSSHNKHFLKLLIKYKSVGWTINSIRIIYNDRIISPSQEHCTKMEDISH